MTRRAAAGEIQTVRGAIPASQAGLTLCHEHLLVDCSCYYCEPAAEEDKTRAHQKVALQNLSWIRRNYLTNLDNLRLDDVDTAIAEATEFKAAGGATIVDVGNNGLGRDAEGLRRISEASGVNIVMGAGYYVGLSHPAGFDSRSEKSIEDEIVRDIEEGVADTGVRAGIIGEIGCTWPLQDNERKVLRAAARAQRRTGMGLTIHIGRHPDSPVQIAGILRDAGADLNRVVMGHLDRGWPDRDKLLELARTGVYLELDMFGRDTWSYPHAPIDIITDWQRIELMKMLIAEGYIEKTLISHDIGFKYRLTSYGGSGYAHIPRWMVPLMIGKGITREQVDTILVRNPARLLAIQPAR